MVATGSLPQPNLRRGRDVAVILLCDRATLTGDAALASAEWKGEVLPCDPAALGRPNLIVDALFGAGLNRAVKGDPFAMIEAMNASGAPILSVDLPSGVNGDTGEVMGIAAEASATVTFFRRKPGHLLLPGRIHCGEIEVADIGIDADVLDVIAPKTFENVPDLWADIFPRRKPTVTNMRAVMRWLSRAISSRRERRGCPRVRRCAQARVLSRWPRRAMRSP
jgi:hypothetical protein